jgi:hypothetical protein
MWQSIAWACSVLGISCGILPSVAIIQTAYEREEAAGSTLHSKDLKVLQAKCHDNSGGRFLCEVTFTVASNSQDPNQRLRAHARRLGARKRTMPALMRC